MIQDTTARRVTQRGSLTEKEAIEIFASRPSRCEDGVFEPSTQTSKELARKFGVAEKTVRDLWNRRSWTRVTKRLWTPSEIAAEEQLTLSSSGPSPSETSIVPAQTRKPGRPRGARDTVSRRKRRSETDDAILGDQMPSKQARNDSAKSDSQNDAEQSHSYPSAYVQRFGSDALPAETRVSSSDRVSLEAVNPTIAVFVEEEETSRMILEDPFYFDWKRTLGILEIKTFVAAELVEEPSGMCSELDAASL